MERVHATFTERIRRSPSVESFRFTAEEPVSFIPGQFAQVLFDEADPKNRDLNKYLSFSCAPNKDYFEVTKRMSNSRFSQRLSSLTPGDRVLVKMPLGDCVFQDEYKKIGFLIGGIGITPVISIIEYIVLNNLNCDVCLLYSNRTDDDIAFKRELDLWQSNHANIRVLYTVTHCEPKDATCEQGAINKEMVREKACDWNERIMFIYGPPAMVGAMQHLCTDIGCGPGNVKTETFVGYE